MKFVGYKNMDRVYEKVSQGALSKLNSGKRTTDSFALSLLTYMALRTCGPNDQAVHKGEKPYWCYWGGWNDAMDDLGMTLPDYEPTSDPELISEEQYRRNAEELPKRRRTAWNRIGSAAKFMQQRGILKLLKPANVFQQKNAIWLLCLGTPTENLLAEKQAREYFHLGEE